MLARGRLGKRTRTRYTLPYHGYFKCLIDARLSPSTMMEHFHAQQSSILYRRNLGTVQRHNRNRRNVTLNSSTLFSIISVC